jgi:signal transduction histidine kinase/CheY-like chemotaxis protein
MPVPLPLRSVLAAYFGDLLATAGLVLAVADLVPAVRHGLPTAPVLADLVLILAGLLAHRVAHAAGPEASTLALGVLVAGSLVAVALSGRWWVAAATGASAAALAPHFLVPRRAAVWAGVGVLLVTPGVLASPAAGAASAVFVLALGVSSLALARRVRGISAPGTLDLEEALETERGRAAALGTQLSRLEADGRQIGRHSLLRGVLTRRMGAVEAIAQSIARDLRQTLAAGTPVPLGAAAERNAQHAERLAWLAGGGRAREQQATLAAVWPRVVGLISASVGPSHTVRATFAPDLPPVAGTGETWVQVLLALVENALEAMPGGGVVEVEVVRGERDGFARISVIDVGRGIPPEVLPHVMEPFYTSRAAQGAEGLGLAMVASFVEALDGEVRLASKPGAGTRVDIDVPFALTPRASAAPGVLRLEGVVLVADDDADLRRSMAKMLASFGLEVVEADTGSMARAELMSNPERFRAAMLDVVMPGTPVGDVVAAIRERRADLPVLLVSGYETMHMVDAVLALGGVRFLKKPFEREELFQVLEDLFSGAAPGPPAS